MEEIEVDSEIECGCGGDEDGEEGLVECLSRRSQREELWKEGRHI